MFKFVHEGGSYRGRLRELNGDDIIQMTFDTGAVRTVLSLQTVAPFKNIDLDKFESSIDKDIESQKFYSATGEEIRGYLVEANNVIISGMRVKKFYYYLIIRLDRSLALLGDDFISYCVFHHDINDDIIVDGFDSEGYEKTVKRAISSKRVNELLELCA